MVDITSIASERFIEWENHLNSLKGENNTLKERLHLLRLPKTTSTCIFWFSNVKPTGHMQCKWNKSLLVVVKLKLGQTQIFNKCTTETLIESSIMLVKDFKKLMQPQSIYRKYLRNLLMLINKKKLRLMYQACRQFIRWKLRITNQLWIICLNPRSSMRRFLNTKIH